MRALPSLLAASILSVTTAPALALPPDAVKSLCEGRPSCKVRWSKSAGKDNKNRSMTIVDLGLAGDVDYDEPEQPCHPHELWLVVGDEKTDSRQLIANICNDGYGARGMGEDVITVEPNQVVLARTGGSSWMWTTSWQIALSPIPRVELENVSGMWTQNPENQETASWSWRQFGGQTSWTAPTCNEKPQVWGGTFAPIPVVTLPDGWDWKTTSLGACSLHLTAADDPARRGGGVVHGKRARPTDASMRVLGLSDQEFVLEIRDDTFHTSAKSWVKRDHVEVWVGDSQNYMNHCLDKGVTSQWGVMLDGEVVGAHGTPKQEPTVSVVRDAGIVRMLVKLPSAAPMVTFVYSDSDDGKTQERLIATSDLAFGKNHTLGRTRRIRPDDAVCKVRDRTLAVERPRPTSTKPLISW